MKKLTKKMILKKLQEVIDPELNISIVDLGLVYEIEIKKNGVKVVMTLTTFGCPLFSLIESDLKNKLKELGLKEDEIEIELTFDPPWSIDRMSPSAKAILGL